MRPTITSPVTPARTTSASRHANEHARRMRARFPMPSSISSQHLIENTHSWVYPSDDASSSMEAMKMLWLTGTVIVILSACHPVRRPRVDIPIGHEGHRTLASDPGESAPPVNIATAGTDRTMPSQQANPAVKDISSLNLKLQAELSDI